jgi:thiol-disulfide isomerase/thioredoxin
MPSWTSQILKVSKKAVTGLLIISVLWFVLRFVNRMLAKAMGPKAPTAPSTEFKPEDTISFVPQKGRVNVIESDKTVDAILKGQFGPAVVMYHADWCTHCKNMADAYESAAAESSVPFVKIQGHNAPVSSQQFGVTGYPTIFGVMASGGVPKRFAAMRTKESLLEFAGALGLPSVVHQGPWQPSVPLVPSVPVPSMPVPSMPVPSVASVPSLATAYVPSLSGHVASMLGPTVTAVAEVPEAPVAEAPIQAPETLVVEALAPTVRIS